MRCISLSAILIVSAGCSSTRSAPARQPLSIYRTPDRQTLPDFTKGQNRPPGFFDRIFLATGDMYCGPTRFGQGAVAVARDIVVSAAHIMFTDPKKCPSRVMDFSKCKFTLKIDGKHLDYPIKEKIASGYVCPKNREEFDNHKKFGEGEDWIVLRLKQPVDDRVVPYPVHPNDLRRIYAGKAVVTVAKSNDYNPTGAKTMRTAERHYGMCNLGNVHGTPEPTTVDSDCDTSPNSSGGSVLNDSPRDPALLAIVTGGYDPNNKGCPKDAVKKGRRTSHFILLGNREHRGRRCFSKDIARAQSAQRNRRTLERLSSADET